MRNPKKTKERTITIPVRLYENIMNDWVRLRKIEAQLEAIHAGRDLLSEVERLEKAREEWAQIAIGVQIANGHGPKVKP